MSLSEHNISVRDSDKFSIEEIARPTSVPIINRGNSQERDIEEFLNDSRFKTVTVKDIDSLNGSVTLNEDIRSTSDISLQYDSGDNLDISKHSGLVSVNVGIESIPLIGINTDNMEAPFVDDKVSKTTDGNDKISHIENDVSSTSIGMITMAGDNKEISDNIKTPTLATVLNDNNVDRSLSNEKPPDYQLFVNQLNKLSETIQRKDDEIRKLSEKLLQMEKKNVKSKEKAKIPSQISPTSSSDESVTLTNEVKRKTKSEAKLVQTTKDKKENNTSNGKEILDIHEDKNVETKHTVAVETELVFVTIEPSIVKVHEDIIPDLRQKLTDLEDEVKRLQRANVDSLLVLKDIQNNTPVYDKSSNDSVINRLLVDHSLLKEELDQLKWEHSKFTQPNMLGEEIQQLKIEVSALRNQNELLQQYVKTSSSNSLNKIGGKQSNWRNSLEDFTEQVQEQNPLKHQKLVNNNSSDYIYEKLHSKRRTTSETPKVSNMLKHSIESMESPYHATCQSIQLAVPFGGGETFRTRKLSDSSSVLIEDPTPKVWMEPVSVNYNPENLRPTNKYDLSRRKQDTKDIDQSSVDSFVSVTTSVTDTGREDWRPSNVGGIGHRDNIDLLSTVDSDTLGDSTDRDDYQRKPKYSYSFTPKSPVDLTLEDLVKFARPGGKMSTGRVCFVGHLPGRREVCVGLELDEDAGKHDGLFEGVRYFQCRRNRGVFISFHKIILAYKSI